MPVPDIDHFSDQMSVVPVKATASRTREALHGPMDALNSSARAVATIHTGLTHIRESSGMIGK